MTPRKWICFLLPALGAGTLPACFTPASYAPSAVQPFLSRSAPPPNLVPYAPMPQFGQMVAYRPQTQSIFASYAPQAQFIVPDPYAGSFNQALVHSKVEGNADVPGIALDADGSYESGPIKLVVDQPLAPITPASAQGVSEVSTVSPPSAVDQVKPQLLPASVMDEPKLLTAIRFQIENRDKDACDALKDFEPHARDLLCSLMPLAVTVSQSGLAKLDAEQVAAVIDQLENLLRALRPHAPLTIGNLCFCRSIRKFGNIEPMEEHATIPAGEMVEVYAEIGNVCCESHRSEHGRYRTHLLCSWNLRKPSGESIWDGPRQFDKPEETMTPPHDHFQHLSFQMPHLTPGPYVLELEVLDVPTGRKARQRLEFAVGPPVQVVRGE